MKFSPDGKWLASNQYAPQGFEIWSSTTSEVKLWNMDKMKSKMTPILIKHTENLAACFDFSPDAREFAIAGWDGTITLWDTSKWEKVRTLRGHDSGIQWLAYSPDGRTLVSGGNKLVFWHTGTYRELFSIPVDDIISTISFSPDSKKLAYSAHEISRWFSDEFHILRSEFE